jgi:ABC-type antimicrobial peptide transport system permease subunit
MFSLVVRSSLPPLEIETLARAEAAAVDRDLPLFNPRTMEQAIGASAASRRFAMLLVSVFAAMAMTLTAVGIYGVVSYSVSQRTREIGIRTALGATRRSVLGLVLRQGMIFALVGIGIGLVGSLGLTRLISSQLFGVSSADPATFVSVAGLLMLITLAACYIPARRAARVDPMVALRNG